MNSYLACTLLALSFAGFQATVPNSPRSAEPVALIFDPAPKSLVKRTVSIEHALVLQSLRFEKNGAEANSQQQVQLGSKQELRIQDELRACAQGRPTELRRSYDAISFHADIQTVDAEGVKTPSVFDAISPLQGTSVVFTWVPEEKAYGRFYDAKEATEEYLDDLREDLELRALLPPHAVKPGESWDVDPALIADVLAPGGKFPLHFSQGGDGFLVRTLNSGVGGGLSELFGGETKGRVRAEFLPVALESGPVPDLARVAIEVELETLRDQTDLARATQTREELLRGITVIKKTMRWSFKGRGTLVWNLGLRRQESFELSGDQKLDADTRLSTAHERETSREHIEMAGTLRLSMQPAGE